MPGKNVSTDAEAEEFFKTFQSTAEVSVSDKLVEQVVGQSKGVGIIEKAARQKRNVLLVGVPGTGKSMLAQAMAELLPVGNLEDVLVEANLDEENSPKVKIVKAGEGRKIVQEDKLRNRFTGGNINILLVAVILIGSFVLLSYGRPLFGDVITGAMLIGLFITAGIMSFALALGKGRPIGAQLDSTLKLLVDNSSRQKAPFIDGTGARAGSLLGDVRHDPFQSFSNRAKIFVYGKGWNKEVSFEELWKKLAKKYSSKIKSKKDGKAVYEAFELGKDDEIHTIGYKGGLPVLSRIVSLNRRNYMGNLIDITAVGKNIKVTQEHVFVTAKGEKAAGSLTTFDELIGRNIGRETVRY